ncbi:hypothetical protein PR048_032969 [Dryococelus australis]|uniref:Uncharacterized protein n=1 Tax=Dryococelus australis TaxID=614101 RepID=A0ABQ9G7V6_9NEOP|nr:hypothetical protein PR048_032969 [Dryococelus australis]
MTTTQSIYINIFIFLVNIVVTHFSFIRILKLLAYIPDLIFSWLQVWDYVLLVLRKYQKTLAEPLHEKFVPVEETECEVKLACEETEP